MWNIDTNTELNEDDIKQISDVDKLVSIRKRLIEEMKGKLKDVKMRLKYKLLLRQVDDILLYHLVEGGNT